MKFNLNFLSKAAGICLVSLSGAVYADVAYPALPTAATPYIQNSRSYLLALNEDKVVIKPASTPTASTTAAEFEPPLFSSSNAHK